MVTLVHSHHLVENSKLRECASPPPVKYLKHPKRSSVTLGDSLDFVLLLDGVRVAGTLTNTLMSIDNLIGKALAHALVGSEGSLSGSLADQVNRLVHSSQWAHVDSLTSNGTTRSNSCGVFTSTSLHDGLEKNFQWVLVSEEMDDLEGLLERPDCHLLLTVCSALSNHKLVHKSLSDWALDLLESFLLEFTSTVWIVDLGLDRLDGEVVFECYL
jgi:hypothetical protein